MGGTIPYRTSINRVRGNIEHALYLVNAIFILRHEIMMQYRLLDLLIAARDLQAAARYASIRFDN